MLKQVTKSNWPLFALVFVLSGSAQSIAGNKIEIKIKSTTEAKPKEAAKSVTTGSASQSLLLDPKQIKNGARIFERATCSGCHPGGGNSLHPNRPLKGAGFMARYKTDTAIEKVIRSGISNTGMPSFGKAQINDKEMKDLIVFIRSLSSKATK